jgi:UDP-N-acetylglucosamine--N-acetylmuramyl-(pentapeptide) pyrophosphoryl-undecaprenol N-acetylglucosamine transferase
MGSRVMIMAGGTGGHVFPALAVAVELRSRGLEVMWLGSAGGFEERVVPDAGFCMETISIRGLRGNGLVRWLKAPFMLLLAMWQALDVLRRCRPGVVLGMGGFVTGPGGVMARLMGIPLVIHEQNAVPGMTNRLLSRIASRVLESFPGSFGANKNVVLVGNPVRAEIWQLPDPARRMESRRDAVRLLILGGSQGAQALNRVVPEAMNLVDFSTRVEIRHQAGAGKDEATAAAYQASGVEAAVVPFIANMAEAYAWADLVICRSGALTVSELAASGVGSVLVPYPHAVDDHQTLNASYLADPGAAILQPQSELDPEALAVTLKQLLNDRDRLLQMAQTARSLAKPMATMDVADICEEIQLQ